MKYTRAELERGFVPEKARTNRSFVSPSDRSIRRGRIFSIRLELEEERVLRERFEPFAREWNPFGYNRRASFGAFLVTAALRGSAPEVTKKTKKARR